MARKSNRQIAGESAMANLNAIHEIGMDNGDPLPTYYRNRGDCSRWCRAVQAAGMPWPQWMAGPNLRQFTIIWDIRL